MLGTAQQGAETALYLLAVKSDDRIIKVAVRALEAAVAGVTQIFELTEPGLIINGVPDDSQCLAQPFLKVAVDQAHNPWDVLVRFPVPIQEIFKLNFRKRSAIAGLTFRITPR